MNDNYNNDAAQLHTIEDAFRPQRRQARVCLGDYTRGSTREKLIAEGLSPEFLDKKIAEYAAHKGDRMLFYVLRRKPESSGDFPRVEILSIWDNNLSNLVGKVRWDGRRVSDESTPVFEEV